MIEKMNALRNKKGFTLIEMLVVIAIIAVLVAIVIPVVGSSTDKAAAAANAANLRSLQAEATTLYIGASDTALASGVKGSCFVISQGATDTTPSVTPGGGTGTAPSFKKINGMSDTTLTMNFDGTQFIAKCGGKTVADFAAFAETGAFPTTTP